jgi:hypothetical protein
MVTRMLNFSITRCPYFKIADTGALCMTEGRPIKDIEGANIRFCLCKNYERCSIYHFSLRNAVRCAIAEAVAYV